MRPVMNTYLAMTVAYDGNFFLILPSTKGPLLVAAVSHRARHTFPMHAAVRTVRLALSSATEHEQRLYFTAFLLDGTFLKQHTGPARYLHSCVLPRDSSAVETDENRQRRDFLSAHRLSFHRCRGTSRNGAAGSVPALFSHPLDRRDASGHAFFRHFLVTSPVFCRCNSAMARADGAHSRQASQSYPVKLCPCLRFECIICREHGINRASLGWRGKYMRYGLTIALE